MCGLSGIAGDCNIKEEKIAKTMLIFTQVRGTDSTGIASVGRNLILGERPMKLAKEVGPPNYLFDLKSFDSVFQGFNQCYIGHNRSKTVGEANRRNAHPFMFEDVVGAHNGTIDHANKNRLDTGHSFRTDSEAIFNNIQIHGIKDTISRIESTEAYALTWYDKRENTLNFIRNSHRPLYYTYLNRGRTIVWNSEFEILAAAVMRENLKFEDANGQLIKVELLPVDIHFSWTIPDLSSIPFKEPKREKLDNHQGSRSSYSVWSSTKKNDVRANVGSESPFDLEDGFEWAGYYVGAQKVEEKKVITDPLKNPDINHKASSVKKETNSALPGRSMTSEEVKRRNRWDHFLSSGTVAEGQLCPLVYNGPSIKAYLDKEKKRWIVCRYDNARFEWGTTYHDNPPVDLPYSILDIDARHTFKHKGKGKRKKIYYRGYRSQLDREQFELAMKAGCVGCNRVPDWGNLVHFVSSDHEFLCEYCAMVPGQLDTLLELNKQKAA